MGIILDGTDLGSTSTKLLSVSEIKDLGWDSTRPSGASSDSVLGDSAYFDVGWTGSDDGQSYVSFSSLGFAITQCKSSDTNYSTISGSKFTLSGSRNKSGWGSVNDSIRVTPNTFNLASPDAGYYVIIEGQGYPSSYNYDVTYERRKVYMGSTVKEFIQKLKNSSIHVTTNYLNGQIVVGTNGLS